MLWTDLKVFGCSIEFLHLATDLFGRPDLGQTATEQKEYCIIFKDCSEFLPSQEVLAQGTHTRWNGAS